MDSERAMVRRSSELAVVDSGDRVAVLNLERLAQPPAVMEGTGAAVWQAIGDGGTLAEVTARVAATYEVPPAAIEADVAAFVESLLELGLVSVSDDRDTSGDG